MIAPGDVVALRPDREVYVERVLRGDGRTLYVGYLVHGDIPLDGGGTRWVVWQENDRTRGTLMSFPSRARRDASADDWQRTYGADHA